MDLAITEPAQWQSSGGVALVRHPSCWAFCFVPSSSREVFVDREIELDQVSGLVFGNITPRVSHPPPARRKNQIAKSLMAQALGKFVLHSLHSTDCNLTSGILPDLTRKY